MNEVLLLAITVGAAIFVALLLWSIAVPERRVWPLPDPEGPAWRVRRLLNRVSGAGIGLLSLGALLLGVLEPRTFPVSAPTLWWAGALVGVFGASLGLLGCFTLGAARSFGEPGSLVARGPYRVSRNPQYIGATALLLGFSTAASSTQALLAAAACSTWFIVAPLAEEPWLREKLGSSYEAYLASAPRYLGIPSRRARAA